MNTEPVPDPVPLAETPESLRALAKALLRDPCALCGEIYGAHGFGLASEAKCPTFRDGFFSGWSETKFTPVVEEQQTVKPPAGRAADAQIAEWVERNALGRSLWGSQRQVIVTLRSELDAVREVNARLKEELIQARQKQETAAGPTKEPTHMCPAIDRAISAVQDAQQFGVEHLSQLVAEDGSGLLQDLRNQVIALRKFAHEETVRLKEELAEAKKQIELSCRDWADDDTAIKAIAERFDIDCDPTPGYFTGRVQVMEMLATRCAELLAALEKIANHEYSKEDKAVTHDVPTTIWQAVAAAAIANARKEKP